MALLDQLRGGDATLALAALLAADATADTALAGGAPTFHRRRGPARWRSTPAAGSRR